MGSKASDEKGSDSSAISLSAEWTRGRDTIDKCDERIDGIRKQGLTFLTGLLTVQGIIGVVNDRAKTPAFGAISAAIFVFSLLVVLAVRIFEKQNQLLQAAAASRCMVIEGYLATELTDTINDRWARQRWPLFSFLTYLAFGALTLVLYLALNGVPIQELSLNRLCQPPDQRMENWSLQMCVMPTQIDWIRYVFPLFAAILAVFSWLDLRPTSVPGLDWSVNRTTATPRDNIVIQVMNLSHYRLRLPSMPSVEVVKTHLMPISEESSDRTSALGAVEAAHSAMKDVLTRHQIPLVVETAIEDIEKELRNLHVPELSAKFTALEKALQTLPRGAQPLSAKDARALKRRGTNIIRQGRERLGGESPDEKKMVNCVCELFWKLADLLIGRLGFWVAVGSIGAMSAGSKCVLIALLVVVALALGLGRWSSSEPLHARSVCWPAGALAALCYFPCKDIANSVGSLGFPICIGTTLLVPLGAIALTVRSHCHATQGDYLMWPKVWRGGKDKKVCFLPPLQTFTWTVAIPDGAKSLRIRLKDEYRPDVFLRKRILIANQ